MEGQASPIVELLSGSSSVVHLVPDGASVAVASLVRPVASKPGIRVAVRRSNDLGYLQALADAAVADSVIVSVNTKFSDAEADDLIERSGADDDSTTPLELPNGQAPYVVFTTSGTTAKPKMVLHSQTTVAVHARQVATRWGVDSSSVVMVALPLCGTFGLTSLSIAVAGDATVVLVDHFDVAVVGEAIERFGVTHINGTDDMFHRLIESGADLSSIRLGGYAAFNSSLANIVERADGNGATLCGLYGMSEVQALYLVRDPTASTTERALAGGTITSVAAGARIVDPDTGETVADGVEGEMQLFGPSLMEGYLAEGGATLAHGLTASTMATDETGRNWFRTSDLGMIESGGAVRYIARLDDALRLGGFLVSPAEIETVLTDIDGVTGAQVIAHDRPQGARPVAFVTGRPVDEAAAIEFCADRLARFKVPIAVIHLNAFPTTESANGTKIQKVRLRDMAAHHLDPSRTK